MKTTFTIQRVKNIAIFGLAFCLFATAAMASGKPHRSYTFNEDPAPKKENGKAVNAGFNNSAVKIYPDILKRDMHVIAKKNDGQSVDFFVFDLDGNLVLNQKMKSKEHFRVAGLRKGTYVYHVFRGDEETAAGKFEIR
jgi:hypothetical protein